MNNPNKWTSIDEAIEDVQLSQMATDDWCDPTDSAWWAECPQIGDLDPCDLVDAWERWMDSRDQHLATGEVGATGLDHDQPRAR